MTLFDLALLAIALGAAVAGWRAGLVHTVLSLAGFAAGLAAAAALGPRLALAQSPADVARRNALLYGAFVLLPLVGAFLGGTLARALRGSKPPRFVAGKVAGAVIATVAVAFGAWVALPASASSPVLASWSEGSRAAAIATDLPRPPFDLGRFIAEDAFPAVVSDQLGVARVGAAPSAGPIMAPSALQRAEAASVQIFVRKCGGFAAGSGFAVAPGLVVTNAHVVAGTTSGADVVAPTQRLHASVVAFDPSRDLALLAAPGLELPTLELSKTPASPGSIVVTLGHPNAESHLDVGPARVQERKFLNGPDPYGHLVQRLLYVLATDDVAPGSSGSAVVDARGEVIGVIYAGPPEGTGWALAVASDELRPLLSRPSTTSVAAGGCPTAG